ncbi:MAG: polyamine aminopropyltransferase [Myxococcota bacterium]
MPTPLLYLTVLIIATSGLVYELLAGTLASYVLGDSVLQFSTTIGAYLFAMGIGSYLSRFVGNDVARRFLEVELAAALAGGLSAPLLFLGFAYADFFSVLLYGTIGLVGILVGLEVPLLMRILREHLAFEELVARVLTFDYIGALVGSLLFAIVLVPTLGLNRTALLFGMLNAAVAFGGTFILAPLLRRRERTRLRLGALLIGGVLLAGFAQADAITDYAEEGLYSEPVVFSQQTPYQRIVVTGGQTGVQLFLNGNLQFAQHDEYRYHEALVHPAFAAAQEPSRVLVLGGGDGLALREIWKHPGVESATLVDLDPAMTEMASRLPPLVALNAQAFEDPRLTVVHEDALVWLDEESRGPFDVIVVDFPDPNNFSLGKLYTRRFYRLVRGALADGGTLVVQSTSPLYARQSFWCVDRTMREAGLHTHPYHATVPSFGEWGFVLAQKTPFDPPSRLTTAGLRFLDDRTLERMFEFPPDMARVAVEPNRLNDQRLVRYYEAEWSRLAP